MKHSLIALVCASALTWPLAAAGAGGGGGGGAGGGDEETTSLRNRDPDYSAAMAAVKTQDWQQVVARMGAYTQRQPGDADGWNELGHAHRQMGNMQPALAAYDKALKINPKHRGVHEYLGEAYLQMGDVPKAEQELKALDKLCFFGCEEYSDLKKSIDTYKKGKQAKAS